jgi:hypothetical protein
MQTVILTLPQGWSYCLIVMASLAVSPESGWGGVLGDKLGETELSPTPEFAQSLLLRQCRFSR